MEVVPQASASTATNNNSSEKLATTDMMSTSVSLSKRICNLGKIDAADIAKPFRDEIREKTKTLLEKTGIKPVLVGFLANGDVAAKKYAEWTGNACIADGITFELRECEMNDLEDKLKEANNDPKVHGIMIYYPCFGSKPSFYGGSMDDYLRDCVSVEKDVEGLCFTYRRNLYTNTRYLLDIYDNPTKMKCIHPCTPLAIVKTLESLGLYDNEHNKEGDKLNGKIVTVINRSEVVGRPLAAMLANDGATVYSVDIDSIFIMQRGKMISCGNVTVEDVVKKSNAIILGVPSKDYKMPIEWIQQPDPIVINVANFKNIDETELISKVKDVKYVPLVGKVTVSMLERNLLRLIDNFHMPDSKCKVIEAGGRVVHL